MMPQIVERKFMRFIHKINSRGRNATFLCLDAKNALYFRHLPSLVADTKDALDSGSSILLYAKSNENYALD